MTQATKRGDLVANILAIAGFIILIIIIVWGLLHLASLSSGWFASLFQKKADTSISVSAPSSVVSGTPMTLSWKYSSKDKGSYALLYQCNTGVQFAAPSSNQSFALVPCGAAFTLGSATTSITLIPVSNATSSVKIPLTVLFMPSTSGTQAQGSASMTVTPGAKAVAETPAPVVTKPGSVATGPADLSITIVASNVDQFGNGTVSFDIANIGGSSSGTYYFTAQLPASQPYTYNSPAQASLAPGSHILSTLTFTQAISGTFSVNISGLPGQGGNDVNGANNYASQYLAGPSYYPNQYQYPYTQYQYPQYQYQYQYGY
jgi:hypothetical protein